MKEEYETGIFGLTEHIDCSECEKTEENQLTELGKSFFRKIVGLGLASLGIGVLTGSPEIILGGASISAPLAYFWAKAEVEED